MKVNVTSHHTYNKLMLQYSNGNMYVCVNINKQYTHVLLVEMQGATEIKTKNMEINVSLSMKRSYCIIFKLFKKINKRIVSTIELVPASSACIHAKLTERYCLFFVGNRMTQI